MTISLSPEEMELPAAPQCFLLKEAAGRVYYPVFTPGRARRVIGGLLGDDAIPSRVLTVYFLFKGDRPLDISLQTTKITTTKIHPRPTGRRTRMKRRWWREYHALARKQIEQGDYPPVVETYLTTMLGERLGLEPPRASQTSPKEESQAWKTLNLLLGAESLRVQTLQRAMVPRSPATADLPLPNPIRWPTAALPKSVKEPKIESIANHVPEESLYIHYGKFSNFLWMRHLLNEHGGGLANLITLRGHKQGMSQKMETLLAMRYTVLADLLGDRVISDVALIGYDLFFRDGPAIGLLYEARSPALKAMFDKERRESLARQRKNGATQVTVKISGRDVAFLSTPDNRVRSFYAISGKYHLIASSRKLVERFFAAGEGDRSLGQSAEFQHARRRMPLSRGDTIFAYFSTKFQQNLAGPQYQIELARRLEAGADMGLVQLARLAAKLEGKPADSTNDLVNAGLLPKGFGKRPDGGWVREKPENTGGQLLDSIRGARGSFLPIPDVEIHSVTREESLRFSEHAEYYRENWRQMDPLMLAVKRTLLPKRENGKEVERIVVDAEIALLAVQKYSRWLTLLGPPTKARMAPLEEDAIWAQGVLQGGLIDPDIDVHHVFVGVRNQEMLAPTSVRGIFRLIRLLQQTPGYLGSWPKTGIIDWLALGLESEVNKDGYSIFATTGLWRRQREDYSVLSFDKTILEQVTPNLRQEQTDQPAQIRMGVRNLSQTKLAPWINAYLKNRAHRTSEGNVRLACALSQQLGLAPSKTLPAAEQLLGVDMICPLGGEYKYEGKDPTSRHWRSTAWDTEKEYTAPLLKWLRGGKARLIKTEDRLQAHAEIDMLRNYTPPKLRLPSFNLFDRKNKKE